METPSKRMKIEEEDKLKIEEEETKDMVWVTNKADIFLHFRDPNVMSTKVVSTIYKIVIDPYTNLPLIKPVFIFSCKHNFYPSGMSFVNVGPIFYFMGGSISYSTHFLSLDSYIDTEDPLALYPPHVYAFDSTTSKLLDSSSPYWIPPMISGKPENPLILLSHDQIYVLSSVDGPQNMTYFETFNKSTQKWEQLPLPYSNFFSKSKNAQSSFVLQNSIVVTYFTELSDFYVLQYDTFLQTWMSYRSSFLPDILKNPLPMFTTLYSLKNDKIHSISSLYPVDVLMDFPPLLERFSSSSALYPILNWPTNVHIPDLDSDRYLFKFDGSQGDDDSGRDIYLGFVEFLPPGVPEYPCELRFVLLDHSCVDSDDIVPQFSKVHASRFSCAISSYCSLAGIACVPR